MNIHTILSHHIQLYNCICHENYPSVEIVRMDISSQCSLHVGVNRYEFPETMISVVSGGRRYVRINQKTTGCIESKIDNM